MRFTSKTFQLRVVLRQEGLQELRLGHRPGEAVQEEALRRVGLQEPGGHHLQDEAQ